jgi:hypothetical protein
MQERSPQLWSAMLKGENVYSESAGRSQSRYELRMMELKKEVNALCRELPQPEPYSDPLENAAE